MNEIWIPSGQVNLKYLSFCGTRRSKADCVSVYWTETVVAFTRGYNNDSMWLSFIVFRVFMEYFPENQRQQSLVKFFGTEW